MHFANGRIPLAHLAVVHGHFRLRQDAADAYQRLSAAFAEQFGDPVGITDAYRDLDAQVAVKKAKGFLAATPGTSVHGFALALDLASSINRHTTAQHAWMDANAHRFGWVNPQWAQTWKFEPWHWEYVPVLDASDGADLAPRAVHKNVTTIKELADMTMPVRIRRHDGLIVNVDVTRGEFRGLDPTANGLLARMDVPIVWDNLSEHEFNQARQLVRDLAKPVIDV